MNKFFVTQLWQKSINKFFKGRTILWGVTLVTTLGLEKVGGRHVCKKEARFLLTGSGAPTPDAQLIIWTKREKKKTPDQESVLRSAGRYLFSTAVRTE